MTRCTTTWDNSGYKTDFTLQHLENPAPTQFEVWTPYAACLIRVDEQAIVNLVHAVEKSSHELPRVHELTGALLIYDAFVAGFAGEDYQPEMKFTKCMVSCQYMFAMTST